MLYLREEPLLEEVMSDPIIRSLMYRDKIGEPHLRQIIAQARSRIASDNGSSQPLDGSLPILRRCLGDGTRACPGDSPHRAR